uniref:Uncharacterized protein LOC114333425 n=1 Tax=Diabrotica virgifera virgifera TaxID=50390 RepID=A0A6P7FS28_DIAVI
MFGYFQIMSMLNSRTKRILAAVNQNDEWNNVYSEKEIGSMPISIISCDNLHNSENIIIETNLVNEDVIQIDQSVLLSSNNSSPYEKDRHHTTMQEETNVLISSTDSTNGTVDVQFEQECGLEEYFQPGINYFNNNGIELNPETKTCNGFPKLVDYDSTSSENEDTLELTEKSEELRKQNKTKIIIGKGMSNNFSSENSFHNDPDYYLSSDWDTDTRHPDEAVSLVGKSGMRKKKKPSKRHTKKCEYNFGKGRSVKENPCKKKCQHNCSAKITEITRHDIHDFYWGLGNYEKQRNWLISCVKKVDILRRKTEAQYSRRQNSYKYFIRWDDKILEVCQQFLLQTLGISQTVMRYAIKHAVQNTCKIDQRGKHEPANKTSSDMINKIHDFIKQLPAVPSHYCRNRSSRKYLPQELRNVSFLYRIFIKHEEVNGRSKKDCVSLKVFRNVFNKDFNLGFHLPKKDKCSLCEVRKDKEFTENATSKEAYDTHLKEKEESKELFLEDQKRVKEVSDSVCSSFDLQQVLNTPHGDNMLLYYSRKYSFYNESIYETPSQNGYCFLWGESDGNRGCNEICTIIYTYLKMLEERAIRHVILYCDSCAGQNKNRAMLVMIHSFLQNSRNIETIKIVFLLPGHTYMPVDSIHAVIERFIKNRVIWAPSEWSTIIGNCRVNPRPYKVIKLDFSEFKNWKKLGDDQLVLAKIGLKIKSVRQAFFQKGSSDVAVKYNYGRSPEYDLCFKLNYNKGGRKRQEKVVCEPEKIYKQLLPISELKKRDLEKLCKTNVIPARFHDEFFKLKCKSSLQDELAETDAEDDTDDEASKT